MGVLCGRRPDCRALRVPADGGVRSSGREAQSRARARPAKPRLPREKRVFRGSWRARGGAVCRGGSHDEPQGLAAFPRTVCAVVYQKDWDPILGRHVGAFSWSEFNELPAPSGQEWERAWKVAEAVYYQRYTPALEGALFFHATYITPDWAKEKKRVARIGRHVFYR